MIDVVQRPNGHLQRLPIEIRWEATRRHPYYLVFWEKAKCYYQGDLGEPPESQLRHIAALMLMNIGVAFDPVDPATSADELVSEEIDPAWLRGSVQPLTFRSTVIMLLGGLPPAERALVGSILQVSGSREYAKPGDDEQNSLQKQQALEQLTTLISPALDSFPDTPLYFIHMESAQRTIVKDVENLVNFWKKRRQIEKQTRFHANKVPVYLDVWDRREGWTGSRYDLTQEQTLSRIAQALNVPISTIANRYKVAFEIITGHAFSPDLWRRLMAPIKLSKTLGDPEAILNSPIRRRLESATQHRPVPDSVVSPNTDDPRFPGVVAQGATTPDPTDELDWLFDIEDLTAAGLSDEEIQQRLDLPNVTDVTYSARPPGRISRGMIALLLAGSELTVSNTPGSHP